MPRGCSHRLWPTAESRWSGAPSWQRCAMVQRACGHCCGHRPGLRRQSSASPQGATVRLASCGPRPASDGPGAPTPWRSCSPATGQGMNAAIQDAANLGWKFAFATAQPGDGAVLLGSYERKRRPVTRKVLAMTHLVFWGEAATGRLRSLLRTKLVSLGAPVVPTLIGRRRSVSAGVRLLSQLAVSYRGSPLSVEGTP